MQVVLHAGAHMTDEDRLVTCLVGNREMLSRHGVEVPAPGDYRRQVRSQLRAAAQGSLAEGARGAILAAVGADEEPRRLVLSAPSFLGTAKMSAGGGVLYSAAEARLGFFHQIFPGDRIEFFFSIRNLASFLPAVYEVANSTTMAEFLRGADPEGMRWSDMIARLRASYPEMPITIWCNEDTPLIWSEILQHMAGHHAAGDFEGEYDLLGEIMSDQGMQRFKSYLASHPGMTDLQKRRVITAFLDKFVDEAAIEEELDVPGWTEELVDRLTEIYDEDVLAIQAIPGVRLISP